MDSSEQSRYQIWLVRGIVSFSTIFMVWFAIANRTGLWKFVAFLLDSLAAFPRSLVSLADYYQGVPSEQILPSLIIGLALGILLTGVVYLSGESSIALIGRGDVQQALVVIERNWIRFLSFVVGGGIIGGLLGSQLLIYPTRHCTYDAVAPTAEYWIGILLTVIGIGVALHAIVVGHATADKNQGSNDLRLFQRHWYPSVVLVSNTIDLSCISLFSCC
jgi:hypothetical protein